MTQTTADAGRTALKRNEVLSFDDGLLTVRIEGHGAQNGWATLTFHERQVEIYPDGFHAVEIPPSELRAIRDFLNRLTAAPDLVKALEALERAAQAHLDCTDSSEREYLREEMANARATLAAAKGAK